MQQQNIKKIQIGKFYSVHKQYLKHCFKTNTTISVFFKSSEVLFYNKKNHYDFRITLNIYNEGHILFSSEFYVDPLKTYIGMNATFNEPKQELETTSMFSKIRNRLKHFYSRYDKDVPNKDMHIMIIKTLFELDIIPLPIYNKTLFSYGLFLSYYLRALYELYNYNMRFYNLTQEVFNKYKIHINVIKNLENFQATVKIRNNLREVFVKQKRT